MKININRLHAALPPEWPADLLPEIRKAVKAGPKIVVLDDDPTGTQTVSNIPVLTGWSVATLKEELQTDFPAFYLLTNSRSLPLSEAQALNRHIGSNLQEASHQTGVPFAVISRGDSTLRGHYPGEVEALAAALKVDFDACLIIPFFEEGGRYTAHDVLYVAEGETLIPAGQTVFANDKVFGYQASNLRAWVEEKTDGAISKENVASISLADIREGGPERINQQLQSLSGNRVAVVNALSYRDLEVFTAGLLAAEATGKRFLYRTAASFVRVRAGLSSRPLLTKETLNLPVGGGLIVVGSYIPKSTRQVEELLKQPGLQALEIEVEALLKDESHRREVNRVTDQANQCLRNKQDVVIYTGRKLITGQDAQTNLRIGSRISQGLVSMVQGISTVPRYILAKGGITSSDIATQALNVKRALVPGQILPGVPVWQLGSESRYPGLTYIVFPGNVGEPDSIAAMLRALR